MQTKISKLILAMLLFSISSMAQIVAKKDIIAGINVSGQTFREYNAFGKDTARQHYLNYTPYIGLGIKKNLLAGIYFNVNHTYPNGNLGFTKYNHDWSTGVFAKKYFPLTKKTYAFGEVDLSYKSYGYTYYQSVAPEYGKGYTIAMNLSGGLGYRLSNKINVELKLNNLLQYRFGASNNFYNNQWNNKKYSNASFGNPFGGNGVSIGVSIKF